MERIILQIRCGTLGVFLDRIEKASCESDRLSIAVEASRISDKIIALTNRSEFSLDEWDDIKLCLEHYSLAVFCDQMSWALSSLERVEDIAQPLF